MRMPNGQGLLSLCGAAAVMMVLVGAVGALTKQEVVQAEHPAQTSPAPAESAVGQRAVPETEPPSQNVAPVYVLRVWQDGLGLFLGDASEPYRVVEAELSVLPADDRAALAAGITSESEATLRVLIEDYAS